MSAYLGIRQLCLNLQYEIPTNLYNTTVKIIKERLKLWYIS